MDQSLIIVEEHDFNIQGNEVFNNSWDLYTSDYSVPADMMILDVVFTYVDTFVIDKYSDNNAGCGDLQFINSYDILIDLRIV